METTSLFRFVLRNSRIGFPTGGHEPCFCVRTVSPPLFYDFPAPSVRNCCPSEISHFSDFSFSPFPTHGRFVSCHGVSHGIHSPTVGRDFHPRRVNRFVCRCGLRQNLCSNTAVPRGTRPSRRGGTRRRTPSICRDHLHRAGRSGDAGPNSFSLPRATSKLRCDRGRTLARRAAGTRFCSNQHHSFVLHQPAPNPGGRSWPGSPFYRARNRSIRHLAAARLPRNPASTHRTSGR